MKHLALFSFALALCLGGTTAGQEQSRRKPPSMSATQAIHIALDALGERPASWTKGCDIKVRPGHNDWAVFFEPIPMGPGLDVMVIVHADGSTMIGPGY
jgi:hypothetical protein